MSGHSYLDRMSGEVVNVTEPDPDIAGDEMRQLAIDDPCPTCKGRGEYYRPTILGWRACGDCFGTGAREA